MRAIDMLLPIEVAGVTFKNPFFIASGPVSKSVEQLVRAEESGWGGASLKLTIDPDPYINRKPRYGWWGEQALTFTGEERLGFQAGLDLMVAGRKQTKDIKLFSNITYSGDKGVDGWVNMAKQFEDAGAHINELNMCCPNMSYNVEVSGVDTGGPKTGASLGQNEEALKRIVSAVREATTIPLFVKLTPEGGRIAQISKACLEAGADAVGGTANRLGIPPFDIYNPTAAPYMLQKEVSMSCFCGDWVRPLGLRDTYEIRKLIGDKGRIMAAGGISDGESAVQMAMAGADLLGVCTAVIAYGFDIVQDMMKGVKEYLAKSGHKDLQEVRGVLTTAVRSASEITLYGGGAKMVDRKFAPCKVKCPNNVPAQSYVRQAAEGDFQAAYESIVSVGPLQSVCGRVCPAPCEDACTRGEVDKTIAIREVKRFVLEMAEREGWQPPLTMHPKSGKKVAVIGSGPAGLTAAHFLATGGHEVTVFEKEAKPGGMMRYGIPAFRLPRELVDKEVEAVKKLGVKFECGKSFGRDVTAESLEADGYDAILMACGAPLGSKPALKHENAAGCISAMDYLKAANEGHPIKPGRRTAVIGGGFTAMDAARTSLRMGAEEVFILYRRTRDEMPASQEEIDDAEKEGAKVLFLVSPTEFLVDDDRVDKTRMVNLVLGEPDESGRRRPIAVEGTEFNLKLDTVIFAIGQEVDGKNVPAGVKLTSSGTIACKDGTLATDREGVFAAGDSNTGPSTIIESIAQGRQVAYEIDSYLRDGQPVLKPVDDLKMVQAAEVLQRKTVPRSAQVTIASAVNWPGVRRDGTLEAIETDERPTTFTEDEVLAEAGRCLACGCGDGCSICKDICSAIAITCENDMIEIDFEKCHGCGMCIQRCPSNCLEMEATDEVFYGINGPGDSCVVHGV